MRATSWVRIVLGCSGRFQIDCVDASCICVPVITSSEFCHLLHFLILFLFLTEYTFRVLEPVSYSQLIKDRAAYDSDKDVANHINSPTGLIRKIPSVGSEVDWMEPSLQPWNSRFLQPRRSERVCNALHLLHTEPAIQVRPT